LFFDFSLSPYSHFQREFELVESQNIKDGNAMSLATCTPSGVPSIRTVLFKGMVREGFSFYTNYQSQKSKELDSNNKAALLFFWPTLERQVRIDGEAFKLTREESETYFRTRPRLSQIGAWASSQSETIPHSEYLQEKVKAVEQRFQDHSIPCPENWGGWHVRPLRFEFWYGHTGRLHDRFVFERENLQSSQWKTFQKSP
jgi:pyridoxamine 5'-phosphate oxidase